MSGADLGGEQRRVQGRGAGHDGDGVPDAQEGGDTALELLGDVGVPVLPALQHLGDRGGLLAEQERAGVAPDVEPGGDGHAVAPFGAAATSSSVMSPTRSVSR